MLNVVDLFCGCGGMTQGLTDAGLNVVVGIDIWDKAIETYRKNHPDHLAICADLKTMDPEDVHNRIGTHVPIDVIVGGPPCQGFSMAGRRNTNDPRNSLFMEYVRFLEYFRPKAFLMENVMGLLSMKLKTVGHEETEETEVKVIDIILDKLGENYNCRIMKLFASDFGVPQNRRRVIIYGVRKDLNHMPEELLPTNSLTERIPVGTVIEPREMIDASHYLSDKSIQGIKNKAERSKERKCGFGAQFLDMNRPSYTIPARYWKDGYDALVKYDEEHIRRLTITELKRIQNFPDTYELCGTKKDIIMQIGNAVACGFAKALGNHLIKHIGNLS